ncbi:hypothetical protein SAMN04488581_3625 [Mycolicibacterium neoaurum]|uniref:hypothetical protein n=1 Tax=Mycolicibacterium neoaurum TaxID=1795 RepID=UPI0008894B21|nr:hypothetical protein [Mycolicibacterium neoaurum]SDE23039.1 hypothetical protein SAMN04488581_3625 [Mycolicibacterium neoaurum]
MNDRERLRIRRNKVIQDLRDTGMTDDEIANALGVESLTDRGRPTEAVKDNGSTAADLVTVPHDSSGADEVDGIIDVEEVDLCGDEPMTSGSEPASSLPAVVPKPPQYSEEWWAQSKPTVRQHRCKAHRKNGDRCKQPAISGATVCRVHGGAARHVKAAARARLENAADLMAKELLGIAIDPDVTPAVKLAAIKDALDRSGLKAPSEVVVSAGATTGFDEVFTDVFTGSREESRRIRGFESPDHEIDSSNLVDHVLDSTSPTALVDDGEHYGDYAEHVDSDRPAATQRRFEDERRSMHRPEFHVTGEDALRIANDTRALPPGRSRRRQ